MKVSINNIKYTEIKNLVYNLQVDVTNNNLPINEFDVDIESENDFETGSFAILLDDNENVWAKYIITDNRRIDSKWVRVQAKSPLILLERIKMPAVKYNGSGFTYIVDSIFDGAEQIAGVLLHYTSTEYMSKTVTGFCPEQTARERLQWLCFSVGAYVKTMFNNVVEILPVDTTSIDIPANKVFWQPELTYSDYVTAIKIKSYSVTIGTPQTTDEWVTDGTNYYIVTSTEHVVSNVQAPSTAQENVITVDKNMLVNDTNYQEILTRLASYWFNRLSISADLINNGEYLPATKCNIPTTVNLITGFINSASFQFGHSSRSKTIIKDGYETSSALLTIRYIYNLSVIHETQYRFIVGYNYNIPTIYIDVTNDNSERTIYMPEHSSITGVKTQNDEVINEACSIAIQDVNTIISIYAVDSATSTGEVIRIG